MAERRFPQITGDEMVGAAGNYTIYILGLSCLGFWAVVFYFAMIDYDDFIFIGCFISNMFVIATCAIGLQFKLIADSVAAGMVMFEQHKASQENQETEQDSSKPSNMDLSQPVVATEHSSTSEQKTTKTGPPGQKTKSTSGQKPPRGPPIVSMKSRKEIEIEISEITEELKMLKPMYNHAIKVKDTQTKDKVRPRIEMLLKVLNDLRSDLSLHEEE